MTPSHQLALTRWLLSSSLVVTLAACGGGGSDSSSTSVAGVAPRVAGQVIAPPTLQSQLQLVGGGAPIVDFVAPGRGLLAGDANSLLVAFDTGGRLRRAWFPPKGAITGSAAVGGGLLYLTTFDFTDPSASALLRLDPNATTQSEWSLPNGASVFGDYGGHVYLGYTTGGPAVQGLAWTRLSGLGDSGAVGWTVGASSGALVPLDVQREGVLLAVQSLPTAVGLQPTAYANLDDDGQTNWQVSLDGSASGTYVADIQSSVDGGAYGAWATQPLVTGARSGLYTISTTGVVRTFDTAALGESLQLEPVASAYIYSALPTVRHWYARGSGGSLFHVRQATNGTLQVEALRLGTQQVQSLQVDAEPTSGDLLARVQTDTGLHVLRMTSNGTLRWAKDLSSFSAVGRVHPLPQGGAVFAVQAPGSVPAAIVSLLPTGGVSFALNAVDLDASSNDLMAARLSDGGLALAYGRRLMTAGPSSELRGWVAMTQPLGQILDIVGGASQSVVVAGQSTGQPSAAFWTVDVTGSSNAACLMAATLQDSAGTLVGSTTVWSSSYTLSAVDDVFQVSHPTAIQVLPAEVLTPTTRWSSMELTTADPCAVSAASAR
jgi:hypothetical protein